MLTVLGSLPQAQSGKGSVLSRDATARGVLRGGHRECLQSRRLKPSADSRAWIQHSQVLLDLAVFPRVGFFGPSHGCLGKPGHHTAAGRRLHPRWL